MANRIDGDEQPPSFEHAADERRERLRQLALGYRLFAALKWGDLGDGHITARDPERADHMWVLGYGIPFGEARASDMVLVSPAGELVVGDGGINVSAYFIHHPIHEARPDVVAAAHTHTQWGTPYSARARLLEPISQEACTFHDDHALFDDDEVAVASTDGGKRIAVALGTRRAVILRNHGLLTVGTSVAEAVARFVMMERVAEVAVKSPDAQPISDEAAAAVHGDGTGTSSWHQFRWLVASHLGDDDHAASLS